MEDVTPMSQIKYQSGKRGKLDTSMEDYDEFLVPAELLISVFCLIFKRYLIILF